MAKSLPRSPLVAVDTNIPLDLADSKEHVLDAMEIIQRRLAPARILVPPTVFQELVYLASEAETISERAQAQRALYNLTRWKLDLVNLVPVGHGIVERIGERLRQTGILPAEEFNDSLIL